LAQQLSVELNYLNLATEPEKLNTANTSGHDP